MDEIRLLTQKFFDDYPFEEYPELERKTNRPYLVLLVQIENNRFAIPFRTNIKHNSCYKFPATGRKTSSASGLDYSKAVIVNNQEYIGRRAVIDETEYSDLIKKFHFIRKQFAAYVKRYIQYTKSNVMNIRLATTYLYSTLKYFHKELGINLK